MASEAQHGTRRCALIFCVFLGACSKSTRYEADAGPPARDAAQADVDAADVDAADAASLPHATAAPIQPGCEEERQCPSGSFWSPPSCQCVPDAASVNHQCLAHTDCALMVRSCCGSCLPPKSQDEVRALPKDNLSDMPPSQCQGVACGACYVTDPEPRDPILTAGCVQHQCELVDLRQDAISACDSDGDCEAVSRGCCPANSADPSEYVGVRKGADTSILECSPVPPCMAAPAHGEPIAFCERDKHCAVRRRETRDGEESSTCVSPNQNVEHAHDDAAVGCDCAPGSLPICRADSAGRAVALTCQDEHWRWTDGGGPCG
jgi:hypothetical protein